MELKFKKTAVLTGCAGYIGRAVSLAFVEDGWDIICIVRGGKSVGDYGHIIYDDGRFSGAELLDELNPNYVVFVHLATLAEVNDEISRYGDIVDSNINLGLSLVDFMIGKGFRNFINVESYWQFDSSGRLGGNSMYAASKSSFSILAEYFSRQYLNVTSLVLYDVYGPNDTRKKLINIIVKKMKNSELVELTEGEQIVDYIHIKDAA